MWLRDITCGPRTRYSTLTIAANGAKWPVATQKKQHFQAATTYDMHRAVAASTYAAHSSTAPFARGLVRLLWQTGLGDE